MIRRLRRVLAIRKLDRILDNTGVPEGMRAIFSGSVTVVPSLEKVQADAAARETICGEIGHEWIPAVHRLEDGWRRVCGRCGVFHAEPADLEWVREWYAERGDDVPEIESL